MSSGKGFANPSGTASSDAAFKGKGTSEVFGDDMNVNPSQDDGWEEVGKKSKKKSTGSASKQMDSQHSGTKAWGHSDTLHKQGMHSHGGLGRAYRRTRPTAAPDTGKQLGQGFTKANRTPVPRYAVTAAVVPPPPTNGWGWSNRPASKKSSEDGLNANTVQPASNEAPQFDDGAEDSDDLDDSDDELLSDGFDSDESQKSHETRKKNRLFKDLFQSLDELTVEKINEPERQWHCPACKGGPGAIDWYRGLLPLISHAKTKRSKRVKLHRELAELLEEELKRRGTSAVPAGEAFGKWKGLNELADKEIVWPPMVIIMNTRLEKDENEKWLGMGNQELLEYFGAYAAVRARHSYGPQGHRGMSALIFEASAVGYTEAERLSKHFEDNCKDRVAWERNRVLFYNGDKRNLYGYMAEKHDMDTFNHHSQGKSKLKFEMRSYQEMVVNDMKQMSEDNQQLHFFKNKAVREQMSKKALQENIVTMTEKLRRTTDETRIVMQKTKIHYEKNKEEMDSQDQFYRDQIQQFYDNRKEKEENFEKLQQREREKVTQSEASATSSEDRLRRAEEFIKLQDKHMEEFVAEREMLTEAHNEEMRRHREQGMMLEKKFNQKIEQLLEKYTTKQHESVPTSN